MVQFENVNHVSFLDYIALFIHVAFKSLTEKKQRDVLVV